MSEPLKKKTTPQIEAMQAKMRGRGGRRGPLWIGADYHREVSLLFRDIGREPLFTLERQDPASDDPFEIIRTCTFRF